jgi:hypothetical protein
VGKYNWFQVDSEDNFYDGMVGRCVGSTEKTWILEFNMGEKFGGLQRVQFYKEQLNFHGNY